MLRTRVSVACNAIDTIKVLPNIKAEKIQFESISIPHIWYNVATDVSITFNDSLGANHNIVIIAGSWSLSDFLNELRNQMNTLDSGLATYFYTISSLRYTWEIHSNGLLTLFTLEFPATLARRLGTLGNPGDPDSVLNSGRFNFSPQKIIIYASISHSGQGTSYSNFEESFAAFFTSGSTTTSPTNFIVGFPIVSLPGEMENIYLGDVGCCYSIATGKQQLDFRMVDEFGQILDVSPQKVQVDLIYSC